MPITTEINDIYREYVLLEKNIKLVAETSTKTLQTLKKYITLKEQLSIKLFPLLDNRKELTQDIALTLCKGIPNPNIQLQLFPKLQGLSTKGKKTKISDYGECDICAAPQSAQELLPCCDNVICVYCLVNIMAASINELCFQFVSCPYCRADLPLECLRKVFQLPGVNIEQWRNTRAYHKCQSQFGKYYLQNLFHKYEKILQSLLKQEVTFTSHHIGYCHVCIKTIYRTHDNFMSEHWTGRIRKFHNLHLANVPKDCAQNIELTHSMFLCESCLTNDGQVDIKSCPHCGIKTIRPSNCNYVKCKCKSYWCFVCNMRLPGTHEGHNVHFWRGRGTSAYDEHCRVSTNWQSGPNHIIQSCKCRKCSERHGAPLCITLDCRNQANKKDHYTEDHGFQYAQYCVECE